MGKRSREKRSRRVDAPVEPRPAQRDVRARADAPRVGAAPAPARPRETAAPSGRRRRGATDDPWLLERRAVGIDPVPWSVLWHEHRTPILTLFALALVVRIALLAQILSTPFAEVANIDSIAYQRWATRLAEGNWAPDGTFYQSPLYAYFLGVMYAIFGPESWSPRVVQILLGSVSPVLVYGIATRLFSRRVGWIAGIGLALYGPIILEEITFSKTTLLVVTSLAAFTLYLRAAPTARVAGMAAAGLLFGVSVVGVGQWLIAYLGLVAWAPMMAERLPLDRRLRSAAAFLVGGLVVLLPLIVWNTSHGGGLVLTSGDAGINFFTGNNERATGLPSEPRGLRNTPQFEEADGRRLAEQAVGHPLTPAQVSNYWSQEGMKWIRANPGAWISLIGQKLVTLWNGFEIPDNYHYPFMAAYFLPLLRPLVTFGVVAPLALVGAFMPFWRRRDVTALYVVCFGYLMTMLIFYVRGRYRIPAVPFLAIFAALAVERVVRALEARRWQTIGAFAAAIVVAAAFSNHERCEPAHHGMQEACLGGDTWFDQEWLKLAEFYRNKGELDTALAYAERGRECTRPRARGQVETWLGEIATMRTEQLVREGRRDDAMPYFRRAEANFKAARDAGHRPLMSRSNLGSLYAIMSMPEDAVAAFEDAKKLGNLDVAASRRLARAYVAVGRCADAERVLVEVDRAMRVPGRSDETRSILSTCVAAP